MSQYRKTNVAEFFLKAHSPVVEMNLLWKKKKKTRSLLLKFAQIFEAAFLQEHARVSSFSQPEKAITREQNVIDFDGHFMNHDASDRQAHQAV